MVTDHEQELEVEESEEYVSRSEKKRRSTAIQKVGEDLAAFPITAIRSFNLPHDLLQAYEELQNITKHEAKRRQMQYIGKILREIDIEPIRARIEEVQEGKAAQAADFHHLERLRERLIQDDKEALNFVVESYPDVDIQKLRQLIRNTKKEIEKQKPLKSYKLLFRYLRDLEQG
ncbi:ribosome biogenesis factor YjgA [Halodesulfovibrio marinisediminis]|uniref:Ribosome-associated protein n=1 Tax=Halodesulfovibrio marinisediminis DSM 17456 TaxID=1121457 RepID=A0A1N6DJ12_9BACT|nr:ribosome biogenesis factor YjgA [Halodesulfovibrio marinisediminis]SIN70653.1 ribosome-associated protein [Halodesulfovibrio marinisediminis DSM 17456]